MRVIVDLVRAKVGADMDGAGLTCRRGGSKMASVNSVLSLSFLLG